VLFLWGLPSSAVSIHDIPTHSCKAPLNPGLSSLIAYLCQQVSSGVRLWRYLSTLADWRAQGSLAAMDKGNKIYNSFYLDTSHDSDWWFAVRSFAEIWDFLDENINFFNRRCKREYRYLRNASIQDAVQRRQQHLTTECMRIALACFWASSAQPSCMTHFSARMAPRTRLRSIGPFSGTTCGTLRWTLRPFFSVFICICWTLNLLRNRKSF
jgi:hypothetical protein